MAVQIPKAAPWSWRHCPKPIFTAETACLGNPINLDASSSITNAAQGGAITDYAWSVDGTDLTGETTSYVSGGAGTFPVTLVVTTATGCMDTISSSAEVLPKPEISLATHRHHWLQPIEHPALGHRHHWKRCRQPT